MRPVKMRQMQTGQGDPGPLILIFWSNLFDHHHIIWHPGLVVKGLEGTVVAYVSQLN
ncbi:hypothetical protein RUA4292_00644 [Ruegeria atlantica]|uniref:Uncharacterized protein n=1 Tax=Ruegeria atlantica TaxID=81569 RepID=A0A0P1EAR9_9RHOB|nr:hypothetical protein RUA4292_00644 [Ruegeria atlantica]